MQTLLQQKTKMDIISVGKGGENFKLW